MKFRKHNNKRGVHTHVPQTLVTKIVAMPQYPGYSNGEKLEPKVFQVINFIPSDEFSPNKKVWEEAVTKAERACEEFIANSKSKFWMMRRGIKTSFRTKKVA